MMMKRMFGRRACPLLVDAGDVLVLALPLLLWAHDDVDSNNAIPTIDQILGMCIMTSLLVLQTAGAVQLPRTCFSSDPWSWRRSVVNAAETHVVRAGVGCASATRANAVTTAILVGAQVRSAPLDAFGDSRLAWIEA